VPRRARGQGGQLPAGRAARGRAGDRRAGSGEATGGASCTGPAAFVGRRLRPSAPRVGRPYRSGGCAVRGSAQRQPKVAADPRSRARSTRSSRGSGRTSPTNHAISHSRTPNATRAWTSTGWRRVIQAGDGSWRTPSSAGARAVDRCSSGRVIAAVPIGPTFPESCGAQFAASGRVIAAVPIGRSRATRGERGRSPGRRPRPARGRGPRRRPGDRPGPATSNPRARGGPERSELPSGLGRDLSAPRARRGSGRRPPAGRARPRPPAALRRSCSGGRGAAWGGG